MAQDDEPLSDYPRPLEMQGWLEREISDIAKAAELRIRDATRFVGEYARGDISATEAAERGYAYSVRWGEPLPGVQRSHNMTDEDILGTIDRARAHQGIRATRFTGKRKQDDISR